MQPTEFIDAHGSTLRDVGEALYGARATYLAGHFDGYVADTYHVQGVGYICWPALEAEAFAAYDDLCSAEERAIAPLAEAGFERVAVGLSRVVLRSSGGDHAVKLARCGMSDDFGDGRRANLVEAQVSTGVDDGAPVVPSVHCEPRGTFGVYPYVERNGLDGPEPVGDATVEGSAQDIREWLAARAPWLDNVEAVAPANLCVWRGRLRTLDYSHAGGGGQPRGVPAHVDGRRVVEAVDRQRRAGEKLDLRDGGGFVEPEVE